VLKDYIKKDSQVEKSFWISGKNAFWKERQDWLATQVPKPPIILAV
jgi:hypothetical protein